MKTQPTDRRRRLLRLTGLLTTALLVMIFLFSAQNAEDSTKISSGLLERIIQWFSPLVSRLAGREPEFAELELYLRKLGHFTEYALLGFFSGWHLSLIPRRSWGLWAFAFGSLYAATDELHQLLSAGRTASPVDVCIDASGVLAGLLLLLLIKRLRRFH